MSLPVYTLLTIGWGGEFIAFYGNEETKQEVLPKIASGEWSWGICATEPGGGSDVAAMKAQAMRKGNKFILNGEKAYISQVNESQKRGGGHCTLLVTDPAKGVSGMTMLAVMPNKVKGMTSTVYKDMGRMGYPPVVSDIKIPRYRTNISWGKKAKASMPAWKASMWRVRWSPRPVWWCREVHRDCGGLCQAEDGVWPAAFQIPGYFI